jgi:hypothetical protein
MANQYDFLDLMKAGGYNPLDGGITTNEMQDFRLQGLINNFNQTNEKIDALNLPPIQEKKSSNIFQKIGSAFGQYGMDDRMPADEFLNLPKDQRRKMQIRGLQDFANQMNLVGAQQSGNAQRISQAQNVILQRKAEDEARQKEAQALMQKEQFERQQEEFIKNNPELAQAIELNRLFPGMTLPKPAKRDSYVAKDGYRYFVDDNTRVFPGVTVTEEQSQADIYKEEVAKIKNIVMNDGIESTQLTQQQRDFYKNHLNKQGVLSFDQALASMLMGDSGNQNPENNKTYRIINNAYAGTSVDALIKQSQDLNPGYTKEQAINELKNNGIIAE